MRPEAGSLIAVAMSGGVDSNSLISADPLGRRKSSVPAETLVKFVVLRAMLSSAVPVAVVSDDAHVVCVIVPEKSPEDEPPA